MTHTKFLTYSGKLIDFNNIISDDICLEDIAHHLCNINRFGGCLPLHVRYSVASHSLNCFKMAKILYPGEVAVWRVALMHDATEAYLGDVVSGLKTCLTQYKEMESFFWELIKNKYKLLDFSRAIEIDKRIMLDEAKALLPEKYSVYLKYQGYQPYDVSEIKIVEDKYPALIKDVFLRTCREINIHD